MDRRTFVKTGLSSLLAYNCSFTRALATTTLQGCRMAAVGGTLGVALREPPSDLHRVLVEEKELIKRFGVQPTAMMMSNSPMRSQPLPSFFLMALTVQCS